MKKKREKNMELTWQLLLRVDVFEGLGACIPLNNGESMEKNMENAMETGMI